MTITDICEKYDAVAMKDRHGLVAIQRRHYNDAGIPEVRYAPDGCYYHPLEWWETMPESKLDRQID